MLRLVWCLEHDVGTTSVQSFVASSAAKDRFQVGGPRILPRHVSKNSACRWRKFKYVLDCCWHRLDVFDLSRVQISVDQRSFALHGLTVWNSLSSALRDSSPSLNMFQRRMKTHLFGQSRTPPGAVLWRFSAILAPGINVMMYLRT